jgi:hypothetical protein
MIIILLLLSLIKQGSIKIPFFLFIIFLFFRLFHLQNDEIEEVELPAFDYQHQTLFCANVISDQYLQVNRFDSFFEIIKFHGIR